jgi:competence protein ComEA
VLDQYRNVAVVVLLALLAGAGVYIGIRVHDARSPLEIALPGATPGDMQVYITGAVARPGVYEVEPGERVIDLLYEAGGPAADADLEAVALAQRLNDEDTVVVPRIGEASGGVTSGVLGAQTGPLVNINTADPQQLDSLPGIGEVYAQRIIDSRTQQGPFASVDDLAARRIIPDATFERIRELITVGP